MNDSGSFEDVIESLSDDEFDEISTNATKHWISRTELGTFIFAILGLSVFSAIAIPNFVLSLFPDTIIVRVVSVIIGIVTIYFVPRVLLINSVYSFFSKRSLIRELKKRGLM